VEKRGLSLKKRGIIFRGKNCRVGKKGWLGERGDEDYRLFGAKRLKRMVKVPSWSIEGVTHEIGEGKKLFNVPFVGKKAGPGGLCREIGVERRGEI